MPRSQPFRRPASNFVSGRLGRSSLIADNLAQPCSRGKGELGLARGEAAADDLPALDDHLHFADSREIVRRIAVNGHKISEKPRPDRAPVAKVENARVAGRRGYRNLIRRHAARRIASISSQFSPCV